jgi:hypothetical protein
LLSFSSCGKCLIIETNLCIQEIKRKEKQEEKKGVREKEGNKQRKGSLCRRVIVP